MNITIDSIKETLRAIMVEETEYQAFFKKALEKAGKSIPSMSDEEKKEFFNKIDAAWNAKGEKNEDLKGDQHKLDVDGDGEIEASDLAALRAGKKKEESVNEAYVVLYSPTKGVKPVTTAAYKDKKDAEKWAKDLGGITMIVKKKYSECTFTEIVS